MGCCCKSNIAMNQITKSRIFRIITGAPWCILFDLKFLLVCEVVKTTNQKHHEKLETYPNSIVKSLLETNSRIEMSMDLSGICYCLLEKFFERLGFKIYYSSNL